MLRRKKFRLSAEKSQARVARPAMVIEQLEPIVLMSADVSSSAYEAWRNQSFSVTSEIVGVGVDSYYSDGVTSQMTQVLSLIGAGRVKSEFGYTGAGYSVVVIDTGVDYNHSALAGAYIGGYDFVDDDHDPMDLNGHGTHVAGIIGSRHATNAGVAAGVNIIALRVLNASGSGSFGDVEDALKWVINHRTQYNIAAVNLSLGAGNFSTNPYNFMEDELQTLVGQGVFIAAASGNSFYSYGSQQGLGYPGISPNTVSVGAVWDASFGSVSWASGARDNSTAADRITSFTQRSSKLDILAPGAFVTSTYKGGGFATLAGTSMASPVVAGAAVLMRQALEARGLGASQSQILSLMKSTGVSIVDGDDEDDNVTNTGLTFKRLDVYAAVSSLGGAPQNPAPPTTPAPTPPAPVTPTLSPNAAFVTQLYQDLLGRTPDAGGLQNHTAALNNGAPREALVRTIWSSGEHMGRLASNLYQEFLGRTPSSNEIQGIVKQMVAMPRSFDFARQFLVSDEFNAQHPSNADFVETIYQKTLGRSADASGMSYWTSVLGAGTKRSVMVDSYLKSTERIEFIIQGYYQDYLDRTPQNGEIQHWVNLARTTGDIRSVAEACLSSLEFYQRASSAASSVDAAAASIDAINEVSVGLWTNTRQDTLPADGVDATLAGGAEVGPSLELAEAGLALIDEVIVSDDASENLLALTVDGPEQESDSHVAEMFGDLTFDIQLAWPI